MTEELKQAAQQALEALDEIHAGIRHHQLALAVANNLRRALTKRPAAQTEREADGLPLIVAGAIFDFAGFMTTRSEVIEVGSTAEADPVADLVKEWAELRGLDLADAAVLSWQLHITRASLPATQQATPAQEPCQHVLYETTDADRPTEICDRNGEVVLAMCKLCRKAEVELEDAQQATNSQEGK